MNSANRDFRNLIHAICGIIFLAFVFCYLYVYQSDLLSVAQKSLSKGQTHYNSLMGSIFITIILFIVNILCIKFIKFSSKHIALSYIPSSLLLILLTGFSVDNANSFSYSWRVIISLLIALTTFICLVIYNNKIKSCEINLSINSFQRIIWENLFYIIVILFFIFLFGNNDKKLHVRIYMEQCINHGDFDKALDAIKLLKESDENLTMLTAFSLACNKELPERLFEFSIKGNSSSLLPTNSPNRTLLISENDIYKHFGVKPRNYVSTTDYLKYIINLRGENKLFIDYILCSNLIDKQLDMFVNNLLKYNIINQELPKHYQEALILYTHTLSNPKFIYKNNVMEADYQDYRQLEQTTNGKLAKKNKLKDIYGNTYWFYFQYKNNQDL